MGPPHYSELRTAVYDGLHKKIEGSRARADRRAPSQISTAPPRTRSCMRCVVGMKDSAKHPAYNYWDMWSNFLNPPMIHKLYNYWSSIIIDQDLRFPSHCRVFKQ